MNKLYFEKIQELREGDKAKFDFVLDHIFNGDDDNVKDMVSEMLFYLYLKYGAEFEKRFKEIDEDPWNNNSHVVFPNLIPNLIPNPILQQQQITPPTWTYVGTSIPPTGIGIAGSRTGDVLSGSVDILDNNYTSFTNVITSNTVAYED